VSKCQKTAFYLASGRLPGRLVAFFYASFPSMGLFPRERGGFQVGERQSLGGGRLSLGLSLGRGCPVFLFGSDACQCSPRVDFFISTDTSGGLTVEIEPRGAVAQCAEVNWIGAVGTECAVKFGQRDCAI